MSSFSLLERASAELLNWLHETAQVQSIEKNTPLLREAEINQKVVLLLKGQLILTSTILKREVDVLGDLSIGDLVGEMSWLEQQPAFATTTAKTGAMVLEIPFKSLDSLQNSNPAIAAELNRLLAQKLALQIQEQNIWVHRLKENTLPEAPLRNVLVLFASLNEQDIQCLAELGQRQKLQPGDCLLKQGNDVDALYLVMSGDAEITFTLSGDTQLVGSACRGELLGDMAFLLEDQSGASADVRSRDGMDLLRLDRRGLRQALDQDPYLSCRFYRGLACMLSQRSRHQLLSRQVNTVSHESELFDNDRLDTIQLRGISRAARHFDWLCQHFQTGHQVRS